MAEASESARPSFTCPRCRRTSWHPDDVANGYCGACHEFVSVDEFVHVPTLVELGRQGHAWPADDNGRWGVSDAGHALMGAAMRENGRRAAQLDAERTPPVSRDLPNPREADA